MKSLFQSLLSLALLPAWASAVGLAVHDATFVPDHVIRVTAQNISQACEQRYSTVINGTSPGPAIRLTAGQSSWIRVYNDVPDANLTMHWHGLAQRMAEFSDGSPLATQWPIPPLNFFDYEIHLLPGDAGTYFYHSHIGMQALTATGALIVEDCGSPPYAYDDERVLLFHEHFSQTDRVFEEGLLAAPLRFGGEVVALMLNGAGVSTNHTAGELGAGDRSCRLPVVEVEPETTYRLRFIGATSLAHSILAFEGHDNLTVVAVDGGQYTRPASTERVQLGSGQRFDVLLTTKSAAELAAAGGNKTDFYIQFETRDRPAVFRGYGVLRYNNMAGGSSNSSSAPAAAQPPPSPIFNLPNATYDWLEGPGAALQPLVPDPAYPTLAEVTRRIVVDVRQLIDPSTNQTIWTLNDLTWNEHVAYPVPLLVDIYLRGDAAMPDPLAAASNSKGWDPRTKSFPAAVGEVLEIVLQNTGSLVNGNGGVDVHPFHAHGEHYFDVASGNGTYDPVAVEAARVAAGGVQPVRRDTTMLYRYGTRTTAGADAGYRVWRLRVSEPGVWMVHCHTLQHMVMGMQSVWVFGNASDIQKVPTDLSAGYFTYGGSVVGDEQNPPQVYEQFDHSASTCDVCAS